MSDADKLSEKMAKRLRAGSLPVGCGSGGDYISDSARRAAEERDSFRRVLRQSLSIKPKYKQWGKLPTWTVAEAILLLSDLDPKSIDLDKLDTYPDLMVEVMSKDLFDRFDDINCLLGAEVGRPAGMFNDCSDNLSEGEHFAKPLVFVKWARSNDIPVHDELSAIVYEKARQRSVTEKELIDPAAPARADFEPAKQVGPEPDKEDLETTRAESREGRKTEKPIRKKQVDTALPAPTDDDFGKAVASDLDALEITSEPTTSTSKEDGAEGAANAVWKELHPPRVSQAFAKLLYKVANELKRIPGSREDWVRVLVRDYGKDHGIEPAYSNAENTSENSLRYNGRLVTHKALNMAISSLKKNALKQQNS